MFIFLLIIKCFINFLSADIINGDIDVSPRNLAVRPIVFGHADISFTTSIINHNLKNVSDGGSRLTTSTISKLVLQNTTLTLDADYSFTYTALEIVGDVKIKGCGNTFSLFGSSLLISSGSTLRIEDGVTLDYTPSSSTARAIVFEDDGSELVLNNATFKISNGELNGCRLFDGALRVEGDSSIILDSSDVNNSLFLGGGKFGDCKLILDADASLNIVNGNIVSQNINSSSFKMGKNSKINGKFLQQGIISSGSTTSINLDGKLLNFDISNLSDLTLSGSVSGLSTTLTASVFYSPVSNEFPESLGWSPDGKYLAIGGRRAKGVLLDNQIGVFEFVGGSLVLRAQFNYGGAAAIINSIDWSPDGKLIAVGGQNPGGSSFVNDEIGVLEFTGSALNLVASLNYGTDATPARVFNVKWSPNGKYLGVSGDESGGIFGANEIGILEFTGTSLKVVASVDIAGTDDATRAFAWSPCGRLFAVGSVDPVSPFGPNEINILEFTGSAINFITGINYGTDGTAVPRFIDWSRNGKLLAVCGQNTSLDFGSDEIAVLEFTGSALNILATNDFGSIAQEIKWSPCGRFLAVGGEDPSGDVVPNELLILEFSGTSLNQIAGASFGTDGGGFIQSVDWSPDGQFLAIGGQSPSGDLFDDTQIGILAVEYESRSAKNNIINFTIDKDAFIDQTSKVQVIS